MTNPVLIEFTRGPLVESIHRGTVAVADVKGRFALSLGDVESPTYPRSSLKPIQALPLIESGAADEFHLSSEEIALACASHSGEPMHTERLAVWLERIGCTVSDLACGAHPPLRKKPTAVDMAARGEEPSPLHNNCSGKHIGFLTLAKRLGAPTAGYERVDHPVQRAVAASLRELSGIRGELPVGIDGCVAPNFAIPVAAMARAIALFADPSALAPVRREAMKRIVDAMVAHPGLVSGTGRADRTMIREAGGRAVTKGGAEGYYAAILPQSGLGIALKIDDGGSRAAEAAMAALLIRYGAVERGGETELLAWGPVINTRGATVGEKRPAAALIA